MANLSLAVTGQNVTTKYWWYLFNISLGSWFRYYDWTDPPNFVCDIFFINAPSSINGLSNTKMFFQFEPVVADISVLKQTNSSALEY